MKLSHDGLYRASPPVVFPIARAKTQRPPHHRTPLLKRTDRACTVMSDFAGRRPPTIAATRSVADAWEQMRRHRVRELLVTSGRHIVGLITYRDVLEESMVCPGLGPNPTAAHSIRLADAMTTISALPAIPWRMLRSATVVDLLEIFETIKGSYLAVVHLDLISPTVLRGGISRGRLDRELP